MNRGIYLNGGCYDSMSCEYLRARNYYRTGLLALQLHFLRCCSQREEATQGSPKDACDCCGSAVPQRVSRTPNGNGVFGSPPTTHWLD